MNGPSFLADILEAMIRIDSTGKVRYISDFGKEWLHNHTPKNIYDIVHADDRQKFKAAFGFFKEKPKCELRVMRGDDIHWVEITFVAMPVGTEVLLCLRDISHWKEANESLIHASEHDTLTGLANRKLLEKVVDLSIKQSDSLQVKFAVLMLDLDGFKKINDTHGHVVGDEVLVETAARIKKLIRNTDLVARLGGDEFVVVLNGVTDEPFVMGICNRILKTITAPYGSPSVKDPMYLSTSIGITIYPDNGRDYLTLLKHADIAMYQAKAQGKNRFSTYTLDSDSENDLTIESAMFDGVHDGEFYLHYQLQYDTDTNAVVGAEALMRWNSERLGVVSPAVFIPIAENNNLITYLGTWALRSACYQLKEFQKHSPDFVMSVNVSSKQFMNTSARLELVVQDILEESGVNPSNLLLEITESTLMMSTDKTQRTLHALRSLGVKLSIDDFGSGFSSLSYLKKFPITSLKIDSSFIKDIATDTSDQIIVSAVINMSHTMGLYCVAEGVENDEQLKFLKENDCDVIQGYIFGKPISAEEVIKELSSKGEQ